MNLRRIVEAFRQFALICSGANLTVLKECASEQSKYAMIGMFVFLTAVFASFSGGYALHKGFKSAWLAAAIGLLWGGFIFNVDRFIVSTLRKKHIDSELPLLEKISSWLWEIFSASPRFLLAVLISVVISTPLELKYFEPEISARVKERVDAEILEIKNRSLRDQLEVRELEDQNKNARDAVAEKEKKRDELRKQYLDEVQGIRGTRIYGDGPVAAKLKQQLDKYEKELEDFRSLSTNKTNENRAKIDGLRAEREGETNELIEKKKASVGFLYDFEALNQLAREFSSIWWAKIFISFLILVLECTPIIMKIMVGYGPYDSTLEADEYTINISKRKYISDFNEKINNELFFNMRKNSAILTVEEQLIQEAMSNMRNLAQGEIDRAMSVAAKEVVEDWETKFTR
jgi:hypothetical protein